VSVKKPFVIIVTGLSGAGKTVSLRTLEDTHFFCVDNLPPSLIDGFIEHTAARTDIDRIGVGIDIREKDFLKDIDKTINELETKYNLHIIFLEADTDALLRRYKETRRPHPLAHLTGGDLYKAVEMEIKLLKPLRDNAHRLVDTSSFTPHQLRHFIATIFGTLTPDTLKTTLISFGFKFGIPQHLDMLLDVRFLPNPHFVEHLRALTGKDDPVRDYVMASSTTMEYLNKIEDLLDFLIPQYLGEGKTSLTIGIGCTGGRHRSPAIVERLMESLKKHNILIELVHRDL
jgi:UPF0042 nucleotide-binding protein